MNKVITMSFTWFANIMILFEIIYMATPFAFFFYSVYQFPLKLMSSYESSLWLVQSILPHFCIIKNPLINGLILISWPLVFIGFIISSTGFYQIYTAKFRRSGAVTSGIYRFIRHPQYTGWIIIGLGMSILWSRMLVWIFYITMIFIYFYIAKNEEREFMKKYPDKYKEYFKNTGMFFFKMTKHSLKDHEEVKLKSIFITALVYLIVIGFTIFTGRSLRDFVITQLPSIHDENFMALSVTPMDQDEMKSIISLILDDTTVKQLFIKKFSTYDRLLIYIIPGNWKVSELGIENGEDSTYSRQMFSPVTHGNDIIPDQSCKKIIISTSQLLNNNVSGNDILSKAIRATPEIIITIDTDNKKIVGIDYPVKDSKYGEIPVVLF